MAKLKISDFDTNPDNNTDINSINIAEGCAPSGINNAIRQLMSDLKEFQTGAASDAFTVGGAFAANAGVTLGDASGDALTINSSAVSIPNGLNFDSNTFVIDAGNNNVGVGTASPLGKLHSSSASFGGTVSSNANQVVAENSGNAGITIASGATSLGNIFFADSGDTADGFVQYDQSGRSMRFGTATAERMRIDSSGNVGIGTSSPVARLSTVGDGNSNFLAGYASSGDTYAQMSFYNNAGTNQNGQIGVEKVGTNGGLMYFKTKPDGGSVTERMIIDSSGNVGIGTSSPATKLEVVVNGGSVSGALVSNTTGSEIGLSHATGAGASTYALALRTTGVSLNGISGSAFASQIISSTTNSNALEMYTTGATPVVFGTGSTERMRIDASGNLLVGVSTLNAVGGVSITPGYILFNTASTSNTAIYFRYNGTTVGTINTTTTSTSYVTSSDYRLKENQAPLTGSGAFIDALQPKTWAWTADGSTGVGFIAHEAQAVSPSSVVGEKDAVDEEGNPKYQGMEYGSAEFIANIIAELQDLRKRVAVLESN